MPPNRSEHLAETIRTSAGDLVEELHAVRDGVEELYILLDHIWRNREELRDICAQLQEERHDRDEENIDCCRCDASSSSLAAAVEEGWNNLQRDPDGEDGSYLGLCPDCVRQQAEYDRRLHGIGLETGPTPAQVEQSIADGAMTAEGLRQIETESPSDTIAETIACARCDADSPSSLAAALQEGWTNLCRDDGSGWNYLGICPACQAEETAEDQARL